ncbi:hypothetical protein PG997_012921 [Apiospora hydei]|uniref:Uncharacterized protein n=1 Tax=Apiospora hydei TaxID=1337664 RepID=A0ABR1V4Q2_9PEZI
MHFTQTTVITVLALAGPGLALPADNHKDDVVISASIGWGDKDDDKSSTSTSHDKMSNAFTRAVTTTYETISPSAPTAPTVTNTLNPITAEPTATFDSPHQTVGPIPLLSARFGEIGAQLLATVEIPSDPSPTPTPTSGLQAKAIPTVDAYVLPVDITKKIGNIEVKANGTLQLAILNPEQETDSTQALYIDGNLDDVTTLEGQEEDAEPLYKVPKGKCTGPNGMCHIKIKGNPITRWTCEQGTTCSKKGSRCFLAGHLGRGSFISLHLDGMAESYVFEGTGFGRKWNLAANVLEPRPGASVQVAGG